MLADKQQEIMCCKFEDFSIRKVSEPLRPCEIALSNLELSSKCKYK